MTPRLARLPRRRLPGGRTVAIAATPRARARGLAGLPAMDAGEALLLVPCRSVHTFGMRFALDLIWLDGAGKPVRVDRDVAPRRLRACVRARAAIETPAGSADGLLRAL